MHIEKMYRRGNESIPPVLGIIILGLVCIISGLYFAFFYAGISYPVSHALQSSANDILGNLLIIAGIILLLIGSYLQKNSPDYWN